MRVGLLEWGMEQTYRIAIWQGPSPEADIKVAFATLGQAMRAAGAMGAKMLVAPELYLPGYNQDILTDLAQERGGEWHARLSAMAMAAGCGVVVGYAERDGDTVYNSAIAFDATGAEVAHYRKTQLYGPRERAIYAPGEALCTFDAGGIKAALLICYDVEFAPLLRELAGQGVRLILVPTANPEPNIHVSRLTVPAHAINHGVTIAYANYCGTEGDLTYVGGSLIAGPQGEVLAQAGDYPALLIADVPAVDPARVSTQRLDFRKI